MPWDATPGGGFTTARPWRRFAPGRERANVAAETGDSASLLSHYRDLIRARHASPALRSGRLEVLRATGPLLVFLLTQADECVPVAHNLRDRPASAPVSVRTSRAVPLFASRGAALASSGGGWVTTLPANGSAAFRLQ